MNAKPVNAALITFIKILPSVDRTSDSHPKILAEHRTPETT